ncbi:MAG TPA: hypothetical protein VF234_01170 [Limnochordia bacterium]
MLSGRATFDWTTARVVLPFAIENAGSKKLRAPARLLAWRDSTHVLLPTGLATNKHAPEYLDYVDADSIAPDSARIWGVDLRLDASGKPTMLSPGERTPPRSMEIWVKEGTYVFELVLHAQAAPPRAPIPPLPPDSVPADMVDPAHLDSTYHVPTDLVVVQFRVGTPLDAKQAVLDFLDGDVVGGDHAEWVQFGLEGFYVIRIPDRGLMPLLQTVRALKAMPGVMLAAPYTIGDRPAYVKPIDGVGWDRWSVFPDSTEESPVHQNWALEQVTAPLAWGCETGSVAPMSPWGTKGLAHANSSTPTQT